MWLGVLLQTDWTWFFFILAGIQRSYWAPLLTAPCRDHIEPPLSLACNQNRFFPSCWAWATGFCRTGTKKGWKTLAQFWNGLQKRYVAPQPGGFHLFARALMDADVQVSTWICQSAGASLPAAIADVLLQGQIDGRRSYTSDPDCLKCVRLMHYLDVFLYCAILLIDGFSFLQKKKKAIALL